MRYNIIKIFVVGSTELASRRRDLAELAHRLNINSIRGKAEMKDIIFVYSFEETGSPEQIAYDNIISNEADVVITIIDDRLGKISYEEAKLAKETNLQTNGIRPLTYGMLNSSNIGDYVSVDGASIKKETLRRELLGESRYFETYTDASRFRERAEVLLKHIVDQFHKTVMPNKTEAVTWQNDAFAYLTVEARFKENYKIVADNFKDSVEKMPEYGEFEKQTLFKYDSDTTNRQIESELHKLLKRNLSGCFDNITHKEFFRTYPFLLVEYYFYYYLLYLYHQKKDIRRGIEDPYRSYKLANLNKDIEKKNFRSLLETFTESLTDNEPDELEKLVMGCLNMNSIDLSQLEVNVGKIKSSSMPINDIERFHDFASSSLYDRRSQDSYVHIITDNCGLELISDILLGSYLLKFTCVSEIVFHIKRFPIFVSDTIMSDVEDAVSILNDKLEGGLAFIPESISESDRTYSFADMPEKKLHFKVNDIWHRETLFKDTEEFKAWNNDDSCALIIVKGDLNYRRLVGDYHWENTASTADKTSYIKKPLLIIRSLKSNVILNVSKEDVERLDKSAPNWKISGQYGIIQFIADHTE